MKRRTFLFALALCLMLSLLAPLTMTDAHAEYGHCGANGSDVTWSLSGGTLSISGTGAMADYDNVTAPWYSSRSSVKTITVYNGVTHVGSHAFESCYNATYADIGSTVTSIGAEAFSGCDKLRKLFLPDSVKFIDINAFSYCPNLTIHCLENSYVHKYCLVNGLSCKLVASSAEV